MGGDPRVGDVDLSAEVMTAEATITEDLAEEVKDAPVVATQTVNDGREPEPQVATGRFTTAIEIKPLITATRAGWVAIGSSEAGDLLYFSQLLGFRCGLWDIHYGLNGAPPTIPVVMEECHTGTRSPNAITDPMAFPIYITEPQGSIETVEVQVTFDDGTIDAAVYGRQLILLP
ncbi:MAG: hypothetical protein JKX69_07630 [Rhodobacteraceae bacterium]|nr:hypothetical protein [Paracoccaceae bacterium]